MTDSTLLQSLEEKSGKKLKIRINNNHSTMLSVRWESDFVAISMHKMFLEAPTNIMDELACYIRRRRGRRIPPSIKAFIEEGIQKVDYSHRNVKKKLNPIGEHHNLTEIYDAINAEYFDNALNLKISWYGKAGQGFSSRINFGLYFDPLKLIKIHRLLDSPKVPVYVIAFIVYHEMLHALIPSYVDENGRRIVHSREFRQKEKLFSFFQLAEDWINKNKHHYFY